jgi:hypothetical protein
MRDQRINFDKFFLIRLKAKWVPNENFLISSCLHGLKAEDYYVKLNNIDP